MFTGRNFQQDFKLQMPNTVNQMVLPADDAVTVNCQKVVQPGIEPGTFCDQFHKCETEIITIRPLNLFLQADL